MLTTEDILNKIESEFRIYSKTDNESIAFKLLPRQKVIIEGYEKNRFNLVKKPRQAGASLTTLAYLSIKASFIEDKPEMISLISPNFNQSSNNLSIMRGLINQLPREIWGDDYVNNPCKNIFLTDSKSEIKLPNGSRIKAMTSGKDAFCSWQPTYIFMDEAAFMSRGIDVYAAGMSALDENGKVIIVSTPNGIDSVFFKTWNYAKTGNNSFNVIELNWYEDPRFNKELKWLKGDEMLEETNFTFESYKKMVDGDWKATSPWYEDMCRHLPSPMIRQELDCEFFVCNPEAVC